MAIVIDGNIGSGKSTVLNELKKINNIILEDVDDWKPYLQQFYSDMNKYSLSFQMKVLHHHLKNKEYIDTKIFLERSPLSCIHIFGQNLKDNNFISDLDFNLMRDYNKNFGWWPERLIYIDTKPEICLERIQQRSREGETIPLEYLQSIDKLYNNLYFQDIENKFGTKVYIVNGNQTKENVIEDVLSLIKSL